MSQAETGQSGEWRIAVKGEQRGPFTVDQLRAMVAEGRLAADTLVWRPGMANWTPLGSVPELGSATRGQAAGSAVTPLAGASAATAAAPAGPGSFTDFLTFRRMVTPLVIQIIFWIGVACCVLSALGQLFVSLGHFNIIGIVMALITLVLGPLFVRVWCELIILLFRIYDTLQEIRDQRKQS